VSERAIKLRADAQIAIAILQLSPGAALLRTDKAVKRASKIILKTEGVAHTVGCAGAEMRQALGTAVFSGMIGVTIFGVFLTPVFYVVCRWLG